MPASPCDCPPLVTATFMAESHRREKGMNSSPSIYRIDQYKPGQHAPPTGALRRGLARCKLALWLQKRGREQAPPRKCRLGLRGVVNRRPSRAAMPWPPRGQASSAPTEPGLPQRLPLAITARPGCPSCLQSATAQPLRLNCCPRASLAAGEDTSPASTKISCLRRLAVVRIGLKRAAPISERRRTASFSDATAPHRATR